MIKGLYTALITPFDNNDNVDEEGLIQLIEYQIESGVDGITLLGTTGESPTLTSEEKERIISIAMKTVNGRVPVMIGCGTYSTKTTIEAAQKAEAAGASSLLIVTPYFNRPPQEGIYEHFRAVSKAVSTPICVYNIAGRCGQNIETKTLARIAELPNIRAVKEASGNISQIADVIEIIARKKDHFTVLSGDDSITLSLMALGGSGLISVISNLLPKLTKDFIVACSEDLNKAREFFFILKPLMHASGLETNPIPIKAMMSLCGLPAGKCRLPLYDPSSTNLEKLKEITPLCKEIISSPTYQNATSSKKSAKEKQSSLVATH
jgi:4-hydroxy-tetrahydrodipicolinate synthase